MISKMMLCENLTNGTFPRSLRKTSHIQLIHLRKPQAPCRRRPEETLKQVNCHCGISSLLFEETASQKCIRERRRSYLNDASVTQSKVVSQQQWSKKRDFFKCFFIKFI